MSKQTHKTVGQSKAKTLQINLKQPTDKLTEIIDITTVEEKELTPRLDIDKVARLWIHGLSNNEIQIETGFHIQTVLAYIKKIEGQFKGLPVNMLKSKANVTALKLLLDSDMILRRYSIALGRIENDTDNKLLPQFITIAKALESQAKTLTDCLVRMGVVQTPEKGKGTQYPHSSNDIENLDKVHEGKELIAYHERRLRALKRKERGSFDGKA